MQEMLNASRLGLFFTVLVIGPGCEVTEKEKIVYLEKQVFVEVPVEVEKPMGSDETDKPAENNDDSEAGVNLVDVTLEGNLSFAGAGSLAIGAGLTGFGLTSETYMLYCTTFEDQPRSCGIPVGLDGNYQAKCEKFAGKSFGCFLRKGEETLTTVEFAGDTSLVAGAGTIVSQIIYDAQAKLATAEIDEQASSALSHEAISAAKQATGAKDTLLGDVSGSWKITCVNAPAEGMYCNPADDPNYVNLSVICNPTNTMNSTNAGMTTDPRCMDYYSNPSNFDNMGQPRPPSRNIPGFVYFHQFNHNDLKKVSIWESKGRKDQCLPSGSSFSEINPGIGMRIQNSTSSGTDFHRFNLTSMNTLLNSLDQTVLNLTNSSDPHHVTLAQNLIENAKNRESWQVEQCVNSPFNEGSCKLRVEEIESYTYYDYQQKKDVTQSYTKYWWDLQAFDAWPAVEAGVDLLTVDVVDCTFDAADSSGKPFCPPHASASGTYNEYYKMVDNRRVNLQLVCKNPSGNWLQQWVAPANTVAGAVTLMTESNKKCVRKDVWDPATPAHPYNGLYGAEIDAIRKSLMDLTNSQGFMNQGGQELCRGLDSSPVTINEVTSPWTFATCDDYTNFGWQNPNPGEAICWGRWPLQDQLGLMFDNSIGSQTFGHFISNGVETYDGPGWLDHSFFKLACPVEYGKFQESPIDLVWQGTFESAQKALVNKCRDEFISSDMNNRLGKHI
jgi:hypothetical protein